MKNIFYLLLTALLVNACTYSGEFKAVQTDGLYTISYPDYMKPSKDVLHEEAILQYSSPYRNTYSIVLRDDKTQSFEQYQQDAVNVLKTYEQLLNPLVTDSAYFENPRSIQLKLYGIMDEENIYYWHNTYETDSYYYQVIIWTRSMDRKQRYGPDIEQTLESFKAFK
jgi:hypothetical protein